MFDKMSKRVVSAIRLASFYAQVDKRSFISPKDFITAILSEINNTVVILDGARIGLMELRASLSKNVIDFYHDSRHVPAGWDLSMMTGLRYAEKRRHQKNGSVLSTDDCFTSMILMPCVFTNDLYHPFIGQLCLGLEIKGIHELVHVMDKKRSALNAKKLIEEDITVHVL